MNTGVKVRPLKVVFVTEQPEQDVMSLYRKVKRELYNWAEDSVENIVEEMKNVLQCEVVVA